MRVRRFPLGSLWTNGYLVWDAEGRGFFVDPGGEDEEILHVLDREGIALQQIFLTHGHADHLAGVEFLRRATGAKVAVSYEDASMLLDPAENLSQYMGESVRCEAADQRLDDGDRLAVGKMEIEVIATPGHTRGCLTFLVRDGEEQLLFSGDTLFAQSVGRTDLPGGDEGVLLASLERLGTLDDTLRVLPGHGPETTIGAERAGNPFWPKRRR